jgi:hypothetical protein
MEPSAGEPPKEPTPPSDLFVVQYCHGGIPEEPELYMTEAECRVRFATLVVQNGLDFFEPNADYPAHSGFCGDADKAAPFPSALWRKP